MVVRLVVGTRCCGLHQSSLRPLVVYFQESGVMGPTAITCSLLEWIPFIGHELWADLGRETLPPLFTPGG